MMIRRCAATLMLLALPAIAVAGGTTNSVPEPETLALLAVGAVAIVIARWRRK